MKKPEIYTIKWEMFARSYDINSRLFKLRKRDCTCEHLAFFHGYKIKDNPEMAEKQIAFFECIVKGCNCMMFRQDNLKYLESLV